MIKDKARNIHTNVHISWRSLKHFEKYLVRINTTSWKYYEVPKTLCNNKFIFHNLNLNQLLSESSFVMLYIYFSYWPTLSTLSSTFEIDIDNLIQFFVGKLWLFLLICWFHTCIFYTLPHRISSKWWNVFDRWLIWFSSFGWYWLQWSRNLNMIWNNVN